MITFIHGDIRDIKELYNIGVYIDNIANVFNTYNLFTLDNNENNTVYFIYNAKDFSNKEDIKIFLEKANSININIYCIIEDIDKKTSFYKTIKNKIVNLKKEKEDNINKFYSDISIINEIEEAKIVSFLYGIYFNKKIRNMTYKKYAGIIINYILTGKVTSRMGKKLFLFYITRK